MRMSADEWYRKAEAYAEWLEVVSILAEDESSVGDSGSSLTK